MVHEARISCIDLISLDSSKRIKRMAEIAFYHQSLTAKPLFEMFRATMMETVTDPDFRKKHEISNIDCEYFAGVFTAASAEHNDLVNKRNNLLHGTWLIGYPSEEDEHSSTFHVHKGVVTKTRLSSVELTVPAVLSFLQTATAASREPALLPRSRRECDKMMRPE
jgi:hypothetical protein